MNWRRKPLFAKPYSQLAYIYDHVMRHVDYEHWANYLSKVFSRADRRIERVLDISCGTANLLLKLLALNYKMTGMDSSESMLRVASQKLRNAGIKNSIWLGSMVDFSVRQAFDAVICTYDSMNYCRKPEIVKAVLMNIGYALEPGGLLVFDVCTIRNSMRNFRHYYENEITEDFRYVRKSYYRANQQIQTNKFLISWNARSWKRPFLEIHEQRIFRIDEIQSVIPVTMYEVVGIYDGFTYRAGTEKSDRVNFVLRRR